MDGSDCGHPGKEGPCPFGGSCDCCDSCRELCLEKKLKEVKSDAVDHEAEAEAEAVRSCKRCGAGPGDEGLRKAYLPSGEVFSCFSCAEELDERLDLVREGWYADPLDVKEVMGYAVRARAASEEGNHEMWLAAMADYCRAVIYRERDDSPEVSLANYMWGIVWATTREGMAEALRRAAAEFKRVAADAPRGVVAQTFRLAAGELLKLEAETSAELRKAAVAPPEDDGDA